MHSEKIWYYIRQIFNGKENDMKDIKELQTKMYYNLTKEQQKQGMERVLVTGIFGPYSLNVLKMICKNRGIQEI